MLLTVGLFIVLPALIIRLIQDYVTHNVVLNFIEGVDQDLRFLLCTSLAIARMDDIQRVFQYHGAEHKAINCYEAKLPLTVDNVRRQSIVHTRCGTNFILIVLFMSVFVFSFFGRPPFLLRVLYPPGGAAGGGRFVLRSHPPRGAGQRAALLSSGWPRRGCGCSG